MEIILLDKPQNINDCQIFHSIVFFAEKLLSKRMLRGISIKINFIKHLKRKEKFEANCIWEDNNINPREFTINIDSGLNLTRLTQALAHEMAHVKQYAIGDMRDMMNNSSFVRWKREKIDMDAVDYWEHPWEIEAYGYEKCLGEMFKEYWKKAKDNAEKAYQAQPNCANTPHTFILETGCAEQEEI